MKLVDFFKKNKEIKKSGKFSDFFLSATEKKKEEVLREVARKANEEQRKVFGKSQFKTKTS